MHEPHRLTLRLFGPGLLAQGDAVLRTHSSRTLALLAFLALEAGRPHARDSLVDLLWSDLPLASGRHSLRQALYSLRTVAGGALADCLRADLRWLSFDLATGLRALEVDVHRFLAGAQAASEADWRQAATLQPAPLLEGLAGVPGEAFEAWLRGWRDRLQAVAMQNLDRLVLAHMARGAWDEAKAFAQAMCALDPASELPSQHLLKIHAMQGRRQAVDAEWARLSGRLSQTLGVEPSAEMLALYRTMSEHGTLGPPPAGARRAKADDRADDTQASDELVQALVRAGHAAERVFAFSQAAELYGRALQTAGSGGLPALQCRFDILLRREAMLERLGRRDDQRQVIHEAAAIADALADRPRQALAQLRLANALAYGRHYQEAVSAAGLALRLYQALDDLPGQAEALREIGFVHWHADQHADALACTREALALHRRIGDLGGEATALHNLAEIHCGLGSPRLALPWFEQAMALHWAARHPVGEILSLFGWAGALRQAGEPLASVDKLQAALALSERIGERTMQSRALQALALHHAAQGELDLALAGMRRAIDVDRAIGYAHALGHDLVALALLHARRGERAACRVALQEALVWYGFTQDAEALSATRERLLACDDAAPALGHPLLAASVGVKSHLALGEGKVYCAFESPLRRRQP